LGPNVDEKKGLNNLQTLERTPIAWETQEKGEDGAKRVLPWKTNSIIGGGMVSLPKGKKSKRWGRKTPDAVSFYFPWTLLTIGEFMGKGKIKEKGRNTVWGNF